MIIPFLLACAACLVGNTAGPLAPFHTTSGG